MPQTALQDPAQSGPERPDWWRPVWICLAGRETMPNVQPALKYLPEEIELIHTEHPSESLEPAKRIQAFFGKLNVPVNLHPMQSHSITDLAGILAVLREKHGIERLLLNWTGGTKTMSVIAISALNGVSLLYSDPRVGILINSGPDFIKDPMPQLPLEDMLALNAPLRIVEPQEQRPVAPRTRSLLLDNILKAGKRQSNLIYDWMRFRQRQLLPYKLDHGWKRPAHPLTVPHFDLAPNLGKKLVSALDQDGLLSEPGRFIPNSPGFDYLVGFWFEDYIEDQILRGFRKLGINGVKLHANINLVWQGGAPNEVDLAFIHNNIFHLISCTASSEAKTEERRAKAEALANHLGGRLSRVMVANTCSDVQLRKLRGRSPNIFMPILSDWAHPEVILSKWAGL